MVYLPGQIFQEWQEFDLHADCDVKGKGDPFSRLSMCSEDTGLRNAEHKSQLWV